MSATRHSHLHLLLLIYLIDVKISRNLLLRVLQELLLSLH